MAVKAMTRTCDKCDGSGEIPSEHVGPALRAQREKAGISVVIMAQRLGISRSFLSDLERGYRNWTAEMMGKYQQALKAESSN